MNYQLFKDGIWGKIHSEDQPWVWRSPLRGSEKTVALIKTHPLIPSFVTPLSNAEVRPDSWHRQMSDKCQDLLHLYYLSG